MSNTLPMGIDVQMEPCDPQPVGDGELFATHVGVWEFAGHEIRCYRLNNGQTVLHADDVQCFFDALSTANEGVK